MGLGCHRCQSMSPGDQPGEPSAFREINNWELVGKGWARVQESRAAEGRSRQAGEARYGQAGQRGGRRVGTAGLQKGWWKEQQEAAIGGSQRV